MTNERLIKLAYSAALENWGRENEKLIKDPNNNITKFHERRCWEELLELEKMIKDIEKSA